VQVYLERNGFPRIGRGAVGEAIDLLADSKLPWLTFIRRRECDPPKETLAA
jgi:hypothetical protein